MTNKPIPCIVGFGGLTPTGRASHSLGYTRMIYEMQNDTDKMDYLKSVLSLCEMIPEDLDEKGLKKFLKDSEKDVLENTLMRKLEHKFCRDTFWSYDYDMPANASAQLPFKLDPTTHYASRQHPKALGMSIVGMSDALSDTGLDLRLSLIHI